jgi:aminoglycoside/choline kinase family phosphotransferase
VSEERIYYQGLRKLCESKFKTNSFNPTPLSAHGSDRKIIRIYINGTSVIGIYNNNAGENKAFLSFTENFRKYKLNVPEIYCVSSDNKYYLMQDLGDMTLFNHVTKFRTVSLRNCASLYKKAIESLIRFQVDAGKTIDYSICYQFKEFGTENIDYDLNYFRERFLKNLINAEHELPELKHDFEFLKKKLLETPRDYFLYRDFQSRNIMLHEDKLFFIDYQSGRKGALHYDLASLLYDAKADVPNELREELLDSYINELKMYVDSDSHQFKYYFRYFVLIRILQAMGAYGFLSSVKGKTKFLESVPYAVNNINYVLDNFIEHDELKYLKTLFKKIKDEGIKN